jgi:hypothetical protein
MPGRQTVGLALFAASTLMLAAVILGFLHVLPV